MGELILVALAGFAAAFVDGALGMGFGPTSSTFLLGAGLSPTAVSATVNLVKVVTGSVAGLAHWRFGNVDRRLILWLVAPGALGAVLGVAILTRVDADTIRPVLALLLLVLSVRILIRAGRRPRPASERVLRRTSPRDPVVLGAALGGGVSNGLVGSWGPVVTPVVMGRPGMTPRRSIGSVATAEVAVAVISAAGLVLSVGTEGFDVRAAIALLVGGLFAAPFAAWTVRRLPARTLAITVGLVLGLANVRELARWSELGWERWPAYGAVVLLAVIAVLRGLPGRWWTRGRR